MPFLQRLSLETIKLSGDRPQSGRPTRKFSHSLLRSDLCAAIRDRFSRVCRNPGHPRHINRLCTYHLHTHLVTANATFDAKSDRWYAVTEREMFSAIRYAGKVYQNELARGVLSAGYTIEPALDENGVIEGFEIAGVTAADRALASKRRAQIEAGIAAFKKKHGRAPTTKEIHGITTRTRSRKLTEITTAEVRRRQRADFAPERLQTLEALVESSRRAAVARPEPACESPALRHACDHLFERASVQRGHEIIAEALNQSLGSVSLDALKQKLIKGHASDCVALTNGPTCLHSDYATRTGLWLELDAIRCVDFGRDIYPPLGSRRFEPDQRLSPEQRKVVQALLASTDRVCALRGVAGAGKTFALKEIQRSVETADRTVFACAPTTSAAGVLRADGFTNATTLADLLKNGESVHGERLRRATLIVDEAGIASNRQGAELCHLVQRNNARLVLVGDSRQHSGVEAGDFLSILERHSRLKTCELTDIRRQSETAYRAAVKLMAQGHSRAGLEAIDRLGWLREAGGDYIQRAADHYVSSLTAKRDVILVAPRWEEINRLTEAVRAELKKRRMLGEGTPTTVAEPMAWTKAQAARSANYHLGYLMTLHRSLPEAGLRAGETVSVVAVARGRLQVRTSSGQEATVAPARQAAAWTVAAPRTIELATGDRVLIRQNHRAAGLVNGAVLTLESPQASGAWRARDAAGCEMEIPADFRAFTHGYAVTSHKSQGRTCDEVIVCAAQLDAKSTYVAFSRARQQATGYTPDKTALMAALPDSNRPRPAALDFLTPARVHRLRWAREAILRANVLIGAFLPESLRAVMVTLTTPAPAVTPAKERITESYSHGRSSMRAHEAAQQTIRMRI